MLEKLQFYIRHSLNDLRVNGQRTVFALLCIAAGVAAIVSLQTLGVMMEDSLTGSLQESNRGDIRIFPSQEDENDTNAMRQRGETEGVIVDGGSFGESYFPASGIGTVMTWFSQHYPGAEVTYRQTLGDSNAAISISVPEKDTEKMPVFPFIVDAQVYPFYGERVDEDGTPLGDLLQQPTDIVLARNLADDVNAEVGDTVKLMGATQDFVVTGIMDTTEEGGFQNFQGSLFGYYFIDTSAVDLFDDLDQGADTLYIKLADPTQVEEVDEAFMARFPYLQTYTTVEMEDQNSQISDYVTQMVTVMGLISLLIGGIGIVNTMLVIVSRRTTEVAVLKTIGLEGEQVTILFLTEAVLMGILGSLLGIVFGWIAAYAVKGIAGNFLATELIFRFTLAPALTGFVVGVIVTAIFGFMPTLAAGQVRPNLVLRPNDNVIPTAGRAQSFAALIIVMVSISLVAQPLIGGLFSDDMFKAAAAGVGGLLGLLVGLALLFGGIFAEWTRGKLWLRIIRWLVLIPGLPILGQLFGTAVPALLVLFSTFITVGILYVLLWLLIWSVGGGQIASLWLVTPKTLGNARRALASEDVPAFVRFTPVRLLITGVMYLAALPVWVLNAALLVSMLPFWLLGRVIQWLAIVDLRIAMRSMLATKGRNASTLLALVIGVFTLSVITMLATAVTQIFEDLLENEVGGNVIIFAAGGQGTLDRVNTTLDELEGVESYTSLAVYEVEMVEVYDTSAERTLEFDQLAARLDDEFEVDQLRWSLQSIAGRGVGANLPDQEFYAGRQLTAEDVGPWDAETGVYPPLVLAGYVGTVDAGIDAGDLVTYRVTEENAFGFGTGEETLITFEIIGLVDYTGGQIDMNFGSPNYAPKAAFDGAGLTPDMLNAIVEIDEGQIRALRQEMNQIPGVFVLETKMLNDLITSVIDRFTSFPILVATLALVVGGIVIANSVALSTLERRREIAIMKAVGLQRERVLGMLLLEYGLMGLIGGLIGVGLGGIGLLYMMVNAFGGELGNSIPYLVALELMGLCILIALGAAIVTAWGASGEKPLNVLRYE